MNGPVVPKGAVVFDEGKILAVGPAGDVGQMHPNAPVVDLGQAVILPGLVNAHTHLELTNVPAMEHPLTFVDWILNLRRRLMASADFHGLIRAGTHQGIQQCLRFGVTTVADITLNPAITRPVLAESPLRAISFGEVVGMAGRSGQFDERLASAIERSPAGGVTIGIEPHAPYSLDVVGYRRCVESARQHGLPICTHLAETVDEAEFLASHTGEFRRLWMALDAWADGVSIFAGGPIRAMESVGLLDLPAILAHVNYIDDDEMAILARGRASVVYCPRTHAYFGHRPHRFREMIAAGINVAVGTDSAASSPDLNLVEDLRLIHRLHPELGAEFVFSLATIRAARALGMAGRVGEISVGAAADFCVFDVSGEEPLREVLESSALPRETWIEGKAVPSPVRGRGLG